MATLKRRYRATAGTQTDTKEFLQVKQLLSEVESLSAQVSSVQSEVELVRRRKLDPGLKAPPGVVSKFHC